MPRLMLPVPLRAALLCALLVSGEVHAARARARPAQAARNPEPPADGTMLVCGSNVQVRQDGAPEFRDAEPGQPLFKKSRVRSGKGATATFDSGGARIWLDPESQVMILGGASRKGKGAIELMGGAVRVRADPGPTGSNIKGKPYRVQIPDGEVRIKGTAWLEMRAAAREAVVAVYEGLAEVQARRGSLKVPAGSGVVLRRGQKGKVMPLLPAPAWEGERTLFFALPQRGTRAASESTAELVLPFRGIEAAARYRAEIGRDEALTERVVVSSVPAESKALSARVSGKGRYYARIQATDGEGLLGPGPVLPITVVEVRGEQLSPGMVTLTARAPRLSAVGELSFDLFGGPGKMTVLVNGKAMQPGGSPGQVPLKVGRGHHTVQVIHDGGHRGDLEVEVSRPSYTIEIAQAPREQRSRTYRLEVRSLDEDGKVAPGSEGLRAEASLLRIGEKRAGASRALNLLTRTPGIYAGELTVPYGHTLRLLISDGDGIVASADLPGAKDNGSE